MGRAREISDAYSLHRVNEADMCLQEFDEELEKSSTSRAQQAPSQEAACITPLLFEQLCY